jgi:dolichol-phosphate mannosyltransferase
VKVGAGYYDAARVRAAVRRRSNWTQLGRFALVGASGYIVNLAVFAALVHGVGTDYRLAAVAAFLTAVTNNYVWNRMWTFDSGHSSVAFQAPRFFAVSFAAFYVSLGFLEAGVAVLGLPKITAQAVAIVIATPVNFIGNKVWTFSAGRHRHAAHRPS